MAVVVVVVVVVVVDSHRELDPTFHCFLEQREDLVMGSAAPPRAHPRDRTTEEEHRGVNEEHAVVKL